MGNERDEFDQRILAAMRRAPGGRYTTVQLARNTGLSLPEVQRRLATLQRQGAIVRSSHTAYPAFQLAGEQPVLADQPTAREAADRQRAWRTS
jgi:hypothetical protein